MAHYEAGRDKDKDKDKGKGKGKGKGRVECDIDTVLYKGEVAISKTAIWRPYYSTNCIVFEEMPSRIEENRSIICEVSTKIHM